MHILVAIIYILFFLAGKTSGKIESFHRLEVLSMHFRWILQRLT